MGWTGALATGSPSFFDGGKNISRWVIDHFVRSKSMGFPTLRVGPAHHTLA
jgi:hypothetical protein